MIYSINYIINYSIHRNATHHSYPRLSFFFFFHFTDSANIMSMRITETVDVKDSSLRGSNSVDLKWGIWNFSQPVNRKGILLVCSHCVC